MVETIIIRYETLCGCSKEEPFNIKESFPEVIDRAILEPLRVADYMKDQNLEHQITTYKRRRFVFKEILRYGRTLVFVYRETWNG